MALLLSREREDGVSSSSISEPSALLPLPPIPSLVLVLLAGEQGLGDEAVEEAAATDSVAAAAAIASALATVSVAADSTSMVFCSWWWQWCW